MLLQHSVRDLRLLLEDVASGGLSYLCHLWFNGNNHAYMSANDLRVVADLFLAMAKHIDGLNQPGQTQTERRLLAGEIAMALEPKRKGG